MTLSRLVLLRAALAISAVAMFSAAVVLCVAPAAIPRVVGIPLDKGRYFIAYLLAASELGLFMMAALALWASRDGARLAVASLVVMHMASGIAGVVAIAQGASPLIASNMFARVAIVAVLIMGWVTAAERHEFRGA